MELPVSISELFVTTAKIQLAFFVPSHTLSEHLQLRIYNNICIIFLSQKLECPSVDTDGFFLSKCHLYRFPVILHKQDQQCGFVVSQWVHIDYKLGSSHCVLPLTLFTFKKIIRLVYSRLYHEKCPSMLNLCSVFVPSPYA